MKPGQLKRTEFKRKAHPRVKAGRVQKARTVLSAQKAWKKACDDLAGKKIRALDRCEASGYGFECEGHYECAHGLKKRDNGPCRHDRRNLRCLCKKHHEYFEVRAREFEAFLESSDPGMGDYIRALALVVKVDYEAVHARISAEVWA